MASAPTSRLAQQPSAMLLAFAQARYEESGAVRFDIDVPGLAAMLAEVLAQRFPAEHESEVKAALETLHLEELVLARACIAGHDAAWEIFLTRYRVAMYEAACKIAHDETSARALADSLYADLYGVNDRAQQRTSKLQYYLGRGSLAGWLRSVVAQEYVNQYRRTRRETSLEAAMEEGQQFAAPEPTNVAADSRVATATMAELTATPADERFLLASYYLDRRTLAEIARLLGVHESTVSRKLDRAAESLRKRICKRLLQMGMSVRQAEEAMADVDVRDLQVRVGESLRQDRPAAPFCKEKSGEG